MTPSTNTRKSLYFWDNLAFNVSIDVSIWYMSKYDALPYRYPRIIPINLKIPSKQSISI